ncbi:efflux RND transporter periplasmic adaptor subunit [Rhizobium sp. 18065]|uniref:efflux RND transporter periplasmic adaptor subunit n=1 Tax=Rhizobium sp. 18065 TaxID=2681411 RepID=UPI0013579657|nr:efflux RND transporter periplasmic adaptor subunit [Rhizobium sp. 18065]
MKTAGNGILSAQQYDNGAFVTIDTDSRSKDPSSNVEELKALIGTPRGKKPRWILRIVTLVLVAGAAYGIYTLTTRTASYTYASAEVKKGDLTVMVTATGSVEPTVQVDVSSEQSGTVREVLVAENTQVTKGEVLARLDTDKLTAELKGSEAALAAARASVSKAEADRLSAKVSLDRQKALVTSRVSSQQDLDSANFNYEAAVATKASAEANVLSAEATLEQSKLSLSKATIVSPIDGIVLARDVDPGATVAASLEAPTLFTLAGDLREMELQVSIDEADVGQVAVGQKATFTVDAFPDQRFPAEITSVRYASETVNDVVTYKGILSVRNEDMVLRQGMTATADIVVKAISGQLLIPNAALRYSPPVTATREGGGSGIFSLFRPPRMGSLTTAQPTGSERTVWVLRNGVPAAVNIEIGSSDGQNTVLVKGDIAEGDQLVTDSTEKKS